MTPADIPREAASVFDDVNAYKLGMYATDRQYKLIALLEPCNGRMKR